MPTLVAAEAGEDIKPAAAAAAGLREHLRMKERVGASPGISRRYESVVWLVLGSSLAIDERLRRILMCGTGRYRI